eukprot:scaffold602_cov298-Pinguiococcus_pyrenoidosus.AAC.50
MEDAALVGRRHELQEQRAVVRAGRLHRQAAAETGVQVFQDDAEVEADAGGHTGLAGPQVGVVGELGADLVRGVDADAARAAAHGVGHRHVASRDIQYQRRILHEDLDEFSRIRVATGVGDGDVAEHVRLRAGRQRERIQQQRLRPSGYRAHLA